MHSGKHDPRCATIRVKLCIQEAALKEKPSRDNLVELVGESLMRELGELPDLTLGEAAKEQEALKSIIALRNSLKKRKREEQADPPNRS